MRGHSFSGSNGDVRSSISTIRSELSWLYKYPEQQQEGHGPMILCRIRTHPRGSVWLQTVRAHHALSQPVGAAPSKPTTLRAAGMISPLHIVEGNPGA